MSILSSLLGIISDGTEAMLKKEEIRLQNAYKRLKTIHEVYYPKFKNEGCSPLLWFCRKDLEVARFYHTGGKEGYPANDELGGWSLSSIDPRYVELKKSIDEAEAKVKEMEHAKGYEFIGIRKRLILYRELSTGHELLFNESNQI
jgi:hypothetical protein